VDPRTLQTLGGWRSLAMVERYSPWALITCGRLSRSWSASARPLRQRRRSPERSPIQFLNLTPTWLACRMSRRVRR